MPSVRKLPNTGSVFLDARGGDRALRATWHQDAGVVVLSLWRDNVCAGSFRLRIRPEIYAATGVMVQSGPFL